VNTNHEIIYKKFEDKVNNLIKKNVNKQVLKDKFNVSINAISFFFHYFRSNTHVT
jgi:hypothetical protein